MSSLVGICGERLVLPVHRGHHSVHLSFSSSATTTPVTHDWALIMRWKVCLQPWTAFLSHKNIWEVQLLYTVKEREAETQMEKVIFFKADRLTWCVQVEAEEKHLDSVCWKKMRSKFGLNSVPGAQPITDSFMATVCLELPEQHYNALEYKSPMLVDDRTHDGSRFCRQCYSFVRCDSSSGSVLSLHPEAASPRDFPSRPRAARPARASQRQGGFPHRMESPGQTAQTPPVYSNRNV